MVDYFKALLYLWLTPSGSIKVKHSRFILLKKKISERKVKQRERMIMRVKATGDKMRQRRRESEKRETRK